MIYLKIIGGKVIAYGDLYSLEALTGKPEYDLAVGEDAWSMACSTAHLEGGSIVLGPPIDEAREIKLRELDARCKEYIYAHYPLEEQLNETEEEKAERMAWINTGACGQQWDAYINAISAAQTTAKLLAITIEFND